MIKVLFFGQLKEVLACDRLDLEVTEQMKVSDVHALLLTRYQQSTSYLKPGRILVAVNQDLASMEHQISDGDELAFFPPVTGG
ncbi:molybdopterin converting factor subunit 1 [Thalassotalea marina]|uniref:Molybdopterin synthase sulfur carrier subunit n=1 Tax=Thalassotalea marina TaxID=1673741 RepID=A0A919BIP8_9GAMM|nr:molybdopterin converting factor subunit 1 [Thalassotalea marina]GHF91947.1 molybdopterin synthase sulfur carrier subunit [Thalassotalea marina]